MPLTQRGIAGCLLLVCFLSAPAHATDATKTEATNGLLTTAQVSVEPSVAGTENQDVRLNADGTDTAPATNRDLYVSDQNAAGGTYHPNRHGQHALNHHNHPQQHLDTSGHGYGHNPQYSQYPHHQHPYQGNAYPYYQTHQSPLYHGYDPLSSQYGLPFYPGAGSHYPGAVNPYQSSPLYGNALGPYSGYLPYQNQFLPRPDLGYGRGYYHGSPYLPATHRYVDPYQLSYAPPYPGASNHQQGYHPYQNTHNGRAQYVDQQQHAGRYNPSSGNGQFNHQQQQQQHHQANQYDANSPYYSHRGGQYAGLNARSHNNNGLNTLSSVENPSLAVAPIVRRVVPYGVRQRRLRPAQNGPVDQTLDDKLQAANRRKGETTGVQYPVQPRQPLDLNDPTNRFRNTDGVPDNRSIRRTLNRLYNTGELNYESPRKPLTPDDRPS